MTSLSSTWTIAPALLAIALAAAPVRAEQMRPAQPGHHAPADAGPAPHRHASPDASESEFEAAVADGRGFGMAVPADRNGYPGPVHVLELREKLALTPAQQAEVQAVLDRMFAASKPKGQELLAAERRLAALFSGATADARSVETAVAEVERLRAELRVIHLLAHVETRALLTAEQRQTYHEARWAGR